MTHSSVQRGMSIIIAIDSNATNQPIDTTCKSGFSSFPTLAGPIGLIATKHLSYTSRLSRIDVNRMRHRYGRLHVFFWRRNWLVSRIVVVIHPTSYICIKSNPTHLFSLPKKSQKNPFLKKPSSPCLKYSRNLFEVVYVSRVHLRGICPSDQ